MSRDFARTMFDAVTWAAGIALSVFLVADAVAGDGRAPVVPNPAFQAECGSCHVPYPPGLLTAPSWRRIMQGLDRHFDVDASVDAGTAATIGAFLEAHAQDASSRRADPSALRITETGWFRREHGKIAAATWARADVKSPANCPACHRDAERGTFSERLVRIPGQ